MLLFFFTSSSVGALWLHHVAANLDPEVFCNFDFCAEHITQGFDFEGKHYFFLKSGDSVRDSLYGALSPGTSEVTVRIAQSGADSESIMMVQGPEVIFLFCADSPEEHFDRHQDGIMDLVRVQKYLPRHLISEENKYTDATVSPLRSNASHK